MTSERIDWERVGAELDADGFAVLPDLLSEGDARALAERVTAMRRSSHASADCDLYDLGDDLPSPCDAWRAAFYGPLSTIANRWNETLGDVARYPSEFAALRRLNERAGQTRSQSCGCRIGVEGDVPLHQRDDGDLVFPMQVVALLSRPEVDFDGGEFVMTERRPRMQSRPMVVPLALGDAAIITTSVRPCAGTRGPYRVDMKHGISRVRRGERVGIELSFHGAPSDAS